MKEENDKLDLEFEKMLVHFKKVNIIGDFSVGKTSLIELFQNYKDNNFKIEDNGETTLEPIEKTSLLVDDIKRVILNYENKEYNLNIYKSTLSDMKLIKDNLDTLLLYSECIILMIDITSIASFKKISELIPLIIEILKDEKKFPNKPQIYLLINKIDLDNNREVSGFEIKELNDQYPEIKSIEISLIDKKSFINFLKILTNYFIDEDKKEIYDHLHKVKIQFPTNIKKEINASVILSLFLLGSSNVGKTTFIKKFVYNEFLENTSSTLGIDVEKTISKVGNSLVQIEIWDTAGQERLRSLPKKYYSKGNGFLLFYDVTDKQSFDDISSWIKDIREERGMGGENNLNDETNPTNQILFLIGNKIDKSEKRVVMKEEAEKYAKNTGIRYFEISCKSGINVYEIVTKLIFESYSREKGMNNNLKLKNDTQKKKSCCG